MTHWFSIIKEGNYSLEVKVMSEYLKMMHINGTADMIDMGRHMQRFTDGDIETNSPMKPPALMVKLRDWKNEFSEPMWKDRIPLDIWQKEIDSIDDAIQALRTGLVGLR